MDARYFDGRQGTAHPVRVQIVAGRVLVSGEAVTRDEPLEALTVSERIGRAPRFLRFPDGGFCEVSDVDALERALASTTLTAGAVSQWETNGRLVVVLAAILLAAGVLAYWIGLPLMARVVADRIPIAAVEGLSEQVLGSLDQRVFEPTAIPVVRRDALIARFQAIRWPETAAIPMRIEFRKSVALGPNALALPSGLIVVTDELMELATHDDEILAVLSHEAGHVQERHGLRSIVQSSAVSLLVTWIVGDVGSLVAVAPTVLLESKYSRDLERGADQYAASTLAANGVALGRLADILERMEASRGPDSGALATAMSYVSSHPATAERIAALRGEPPGQAR
jgi:Zn-dependent protease with chaperone function